ncbi:hypothetical protein CF15_06780 [Pyrodictium occultum]|uniref:N-(5'-phosphoribosyl)anthranilate isomerase n=1 Tax=Pyrodictium occultum TaxID=2309 RepID=A0A0V8RWH0_PYROC|nr:hypothetical protein [Pyrodictium occultum]KSW12425.1 hypothetical protein CF15_06780 [Pyrodictium occultum]
MLRLKICGLTRPEDVEALDGAADYLGFVVAPSRLSPRVLSPGEARSLAETVSRSRPVLVAAGYGPRDAVELAARLEAFRVLQYHEPAGPEVLAGLARELGSIGVSLAPVSLWDGRRLSPDPCEAATVAPGHEYLLVDAVKGLGLRYAGGLRAPLEAYLRAAVCSSRAAAAGGVVPENACLVASTGVSMLDVSSGVEAEPGRKDLSRVEKLLEVLRSCS